MTIFWLIIIALSVYHIRNKYRPARRKIITNRTTVSNKQQREDSFQNLMATIRDNQKRRETRDDPQGYDDPIKQLYDQKVAKSLIKGYKGDLKWQKLSKEFGATAKRNREAEEHSINKIE